MLQHAINQNSKGLFLGEVGSFISDYHPASVWIENLNESLDAKFHALRYSISDAVGLQNEVTVGVPALADSALLVIAYSCCNFA